MIHRVKTWKDRKFHVEWQCLEWRSNFTLCLKTKDIAKSAGGRHFFSDLLYASQTLGDNAHEGGEQTPWAKTAAEFSRFIWTSYFVLTDQLKRLPVDKFRDSNRLQKYSFRFISKRTLGNDSHESGEQTPWAKTAAKFSPFIFDFLFRVKDV